MEHDSFERKLSRRAFLRAAAAGTGLSLLAACGTPAAGTSPTAAPAGATAAPAAPAAATAAPAAATAVPAATAASAATAPAATAAAAPKPTNTPAPLPQGSAGKLTVIHRTEYFENVQTIFRDTVTKYAADKGIELDISTANPEQFGDFNAKLQAAVQAGNPPDLAYTTLAIPQLYFLDVLEDVSDVVEQAVQKYGAVVPPQAEKNAKIDGKWWAVPFQSNAGGWFLRKDVFDAAGVDITKLTDYASYREAALKASDPSKNMFGWGITINKSGDGHGFITHCIQCFGGRFVDQTGEKVTFNSPETIAGVKFIAETYTDPKYKNLMPPGVLSWTDPSNNEAYLAGTVALTANAYSVYAKAKKDNNPVFPNTAVLQPPRANDGTALFSGASGWFTISKGAPNKDAAKQLILYMLDPANFNAMVKEGGGLIMPAYKNLWTPDVLAIDPNFKALQEIMFNDTPYTGQAYPANPNAAIAGIDSQGITSQMMANIVNGSMTVEQAVEDAHKKIVGIFEELGLPQS